MTKAFAAAPGKSAGALDHLDELIAKYGGRVPRYTSYPTAVQFSADVGAADYRAWLGRTGCADGPVSLYLHIPFCAQLCWYCGCHTKVVNGAGPIAEYVDDLLAEIDLVAAALPERLRVGSVHFGGGTPNMLSTAELSRILDRLAARFDLPAEAEIALEADPRLLTLAWARAAVRSGVKRVSLGVQDFRPEVQRAINRVQPYAQVAAAVDDLHAAGLDAINLDLMYGLPRQTFASLETTVAEALTLAPDRLSLFGYAHVPWLKPHQKLIAEPMLPDARQRLLMQRRVTALLETAGFRRLGLDHFARPDDQLAAHAAEKQMRRNFQGYTTDAAEVLLGFGASAISRLPQAYVQNAADVTAWRAAIEAGLLPTARGVVIDAQDLLRGAIIERLMCDFSVDLETIAAEHGMACDFDREYAALAQMEEDGILRRDGTQISVTAEGRDFVRSVCAVFDSYLAQQMPRHSQETPRHAPGV